MLLTYINPSLLARITVFIVLLWYLVSRQTYTMTQAQQQLTFHLTRKGEKSLGFVLVAGAKVTEFAYGFHAPWSY